VTGRSVKGSVLKSRLAFVEERAGAAGLERVLARLEPEDRDVLGGVLLAAGWYPFETGARLDAAIADELGGGERVYRALGARSAQDKLSASHKAY